MLRRDRATRPMPATEVAKSPPPSGVVGAGCAAVAGACCAVALAEASAAESSVDRFGVDMERVANSDGRMGSGAEGAEGAKAAGGTGRLSAAIMAGAGAGGCETE